jgi:hypothetical protein
LRRSGVARVRPRLTKSRCEAPRSSQRRAYAHTCMATDDQGAPTVSIYDVIAAELPLPNIVDESLAKDALHRPVGSRKTHTDQGRAARQLAASKPEAFRFERLELLGDAMLQAWCAATLLEETKDVNVAILAASSRCLLRCRSRVPTRPTKITCSATKLSLSFPLLMACIRQPCHPTLTSSSLPLNVPRP